LGVQLDWSDFDELDIHKQQNKSALQSFTLTRVGDLLNEPSEHNEWVINDLLLRGGFSLLAGKPKAGKSTLTRCLAQAVARGHEFLGRTVKQGGVLFFSLEDHRTMLKKEFQRLGADSEDKIWVHCGSVNGDRYGILERAIEAHEPSLVIIDTIFRFTRCFDTNSYTQVLEALTPVSDLARKTGVHILAVHHAGKSERADSLDSVLGSVAVHGSMDCTLLLRRTSEYRIIESQQRYGHDLPPTVLEYDPCTGWIESGSLLENIETQRLGSQILELLENADQALTEREIVDSVSGKTTMLRKSLRSLVESGKVNRSGTGQRGHAFLYSSIVE